MTNVDGNQGNLGGSKITDSIKKAVPPIRRETPTGYYEREFEQPVVLKQSPLWSRAIVWTIVGVTTFGVAWSAIAKIEQVVLARGQLKPEGAVKEIQAPVSGVVEKVHVEGGDKVQVNDPLITFESTADEVQLKSLKEILNSVKAQNQYYRRLLSQTNGEVNGSSSALLEIPDAVRSQARQLNTLRAENDEFSAQIRGVGTSPRAFAAQREIESRRQAKREEIEQLRRQKDQQLSQRQQTFAEQRQLSKQREQVQVQIEDTQGQLQTATEIRDSLSILNDEGAFPQLQFKQQVQEVQSLSAEVNRLQKEVERLTIAINQQNSAIREVESAMRQTDASIQQRRQEFNNIGDAAEVNLRDRIASNNNNLAQIESDFSRRITENDNRIKELESQISQLSQTRRYQEIKAPVAGTIFNLQSKSPGFVANPTDVLLEIVPEDSLVAEVFITTTDIGFVREGMKVEVRIDTFPFSEFGDVEGKVTFIGSEALEPDQLNNFYRFPATVTLDKQELKIEGREKPLPLQSGMSISANIIIRENRTVLSIFTDKFTKGIESLKEIR